MYHIVCPAKYRSVVFSKEVENTVKQTCEEISLRFEIYFIEIGTDKDHVHFLVQSVPTMSPTKVVTTIKSILARVIFQNHPEVKKILWGGQFWTDGYYINTVSRYGGESQIQKYIKNQGQNYKVEYKTISTNKELSQDLFE